MKILLSVIIILISSQSVFAFENCNSLEESNLENDALIESSDTDEEKTEVSHETREQQEYKFEAKPYISFTYSSSKITT